ncbi:cell division protein SepF [Thermobispora bispora]|nr:cell division protein SepF [Thermobispora bispora]
MTQDMPHARRTSNPRCPRAGDRIPGDHHDTKDPPVIKKLRPKDYSDAFYVGHCFRSGTAVVMDVSHLPDDVARPLVDFCAGLVYGRGGDMERLD